MNQPVAFGLLLGGGVLLTSALTGSSLADVVQGHPAKVSTTGVTIQGASSSPASAGVAGVGGTLTSGLNAFTQAGKSGGLGYTNPFAKAKITSVERIDQGQDFALAPGSPILAPGNSTYLGQIPNWYNGQPYYAFKLTSGPLAGEVYYLAEEIRLAGGLSPGQSVSQGQTIANYVSSGTGLEIGWADPSNWRQTLAQSTTGYTEGQQTTAGEEFHKFLVEVGAIS